MQEVRALHNPCGRRSVFKKKRLKGDTPMNLFQVDSTESWGLFLSWTATVLSAAKRYCECVWPPSSRSRLINYQARGPCLSLAPRKPRDHLYSNHKSNSAVTPPPNAFPKSRHLTVVTTVRQAAPQASWYCLLTLLPSLPCSPGWPGTPDNPCRKNTRHCDLGAAILCIWQGEGTGGGADRCLRHMFSAVSCSGSKHTVALARLEEREEGSAVIVVLVHKDISQGITGDLKPQLLRPFSIRQI